MAWIYLSAAIVFEVTGTLLLKKSNGFEAMVLGVGAVSLYLVSTVLLALALKVIDVGVAYAIWSALGTALIVVGGVMLFGETLTALKLLFGVMIIAGVVGLRLTAAQV